MGYDIAKVVLQATSTVYSPAKDMLSFMKDKAKYVKNLEDNFIKISSLLGTFYSRKEEIDRLLETSVSKEKSDEFDILVKKNEVFLKRYKKFVDKYGRYCRDVPSFDVNDISSVIKIIDAMEERKPTILTHKFFKLANLSKEIYKLVDHITHIVSEMKAENVLREKMIEVVQVKHGDIDLPSSNEYVEKILRYLHEDDNRSIGILGPIGVGKTTILKRLNNQLKHSPPLEMEIEIKFDVVIWINHDKQEAVGDKATEVIQDVIMRRLKLNREKTNNMEQNANIISEFLWNRKYILLFDQVSSVINFDDVGIHKDHKFGKVVIASSSKKIIIQMTDEHVEIQPLSNNEAMDLFQKSCGSIYDARIKLIANSIVRSCGGLPLVIKLVAYHLKGVKDENVWSDVKMALQSETKAKLQKLDGVVHAYKLVYDKLEESHMKCLLFVTLFPSDHKIYKDYLVECWNAERFLELDIQELRSARERGATVLRELTDQYLLENYSTKHVKMPEYFRKVVVEQEYPGEKNCLGWAPQKIQPLTEETWRTTKRISLICCKSKLPDNPKNENISTLLMQCNHDLKALGDPFFVNMQNLCILDLHQTMIESLPSSISSLISLICLYVNECPKLVKLPPEVKKLKKLELLDIRGTSIHSLPIEIGYMFNLRCLRVSFSRKGCKRDGKCREVEMEIPHNIISRLHELEELTIEVGCCSEAWNTVVDRITIELASLEKLNALNFHFPKVSNLAKFVNDSKSLNDTNTHRSTSTLRSFNISIGCSEMRHSYGSDIVGISAERQLRFSTNEDISSVKEILRQASSFELASHCGVESLSDFDLENAGTLKVCVVECCNNMKSIVDFSNTRVERIGCSMLQCLEKLHLFDLQMLQSIWKGPVFSGSLANLKALTLFGCPELSVILNYELARALSSLEHVKVENCSEVKQIIEVENLDRHDISENVDPHNILNKLMTIELVNLPRLESISKDTSMNWKSVVNIVIIGCHRLGDLHCTLKSVEKLQKIKCEDSWWFGLQLPQEQGKQFLPRCEFVVIEQNPEITGNHEGESSEHGRLSLPSTSSSDREMPRNGNNLSMHIDHAHKHNEMNKGVEPVTHHSRNTNAPPNKEALSVQRCSTTDFSISSH